MIEALKNLASLGEHQSKYRAQAMLAVGLCLTGCSQPKAETNVLPGRSEAKATTEDIKPKHKSTRTITIRVTPLTQENSLCVE